MPRMPRPFSTNALCIPMRQFYALTIYPLAALWLSRFLDSLASSLPIITSLLVRRAIHRASSNTHHLLAVVVRHRHGMDTTALHPPRSVALPGSPLMLAPQGASAHPHRRLPRRPPFLIPNSCTSHPNYPRTYSPTTREHLLYCATIYLMGLRRHTARTLVVGVGMRTRLCRVVVVATLRPTD
ncbi:hypothetical protein FB107DRAFT_267715 [Schizophyllum commune]